MRRIACVGIIALAACARAPEFTPYEDPGGDYRLEAPKGWQTMGNANRKAKPVSAVMFMGKIVKQEEGIPLGVALTVTKLYRRRSDYPGKTEDYRNYRQDALVPASVLFGEPPSLLPEASRKLLPAEVKEIRLSGLPAKTYRREVTISSIPMVVEDAVLQTPEAYFVVEYRVPAELFERYHYAFDRAKSTFTLLR